ncbi:hypothetical protein ACN47E_006701 [Coniothyrium glycines]
MSALVQFPFLEKFTRAKGFVRSFECGSDERRMSVTVPAKITESLFSCMNVDPTSYWMDLTQAVLGFGEEEVADDASIETSMLQTHQIVTQIREAVMDGGRHSLAGFTWSSSLETICFEFFHPSKIQKYLTLFWYCWYPNWPVIHRPSFQGRFADSTLIAAMAILGACLSPEERELVTAKLWLNVVEEIVFGHDMFLDHKLNDTWHTSNDSPDRQRQLELLQAAYCVCLYQTWEGCKRSKQRVLRHRFSNIVYFARDIGLAEASLRGIDTTSLATFDWKEYVLRESLIRIFSYICNIDASYAIFFRHPPRMVLSELAIEMSSPELCFRAGSKEECFIELKTWRSKLSNYNISPTILSVVEALSDDSLTSGVDMRTILTHLSILNMFTIVHALYLQVFRLQTSGSRALNEIEIRSIATALRNWKESWPSPCRDEELSEFTHKNNDGPTSWQRVGFIKHAPEYWLLTQLTLEKLKRRSPPCNDIAQHTTLGGKDDDMFETKLLIAELRSASMSSSSSNHNV